jgi:hypothetical protein
MKNILGGQIGSNLNILGVKSLLLTLLAVFA